MSSGVVSPKTFVLALQMATFLLYLHADLSLNIHSPGVYVSKFPLPYKGTSRIGLVLTLMTSF